MTSFNYNLIEKKKDGWSVVFWSGLSLGFFGSYDMQYHASFTSLWRLVHIVCIYTDVRDDTSPSFLLFKSILPLILLQLSSGREHETRDGTSGRCHGCYIKNCQQIPKFRWCCICSQQERSACWGMPWLDIPVLGKEFQHAWRGGHYSISLAVAVPGNRKFAHWHSEYFTRGDGHYFLHWCSLMM